MKTSIVERVLFDTWASMFLAWPEWAHSYYLSTAKTINTDFQVILSAQLIGSLRHDLALTLVAAQGYRRIKKQRSLSDFLSFIRTHVLRNQTQPRRNYSRIFGLARLVNTFILRRGKVVGIGEFETFVESIQELYARTTLLDRKTPKLVGPPVCRNHRICPTRELLYKFVKSDEFHHLQDKGRKFMQKDVFPRLVRLCCAALRCQHRGQNPDVILGSWKKTQSFLRQHLPEVENLYRSTDHLLQAVSTWTLERKFLLRVNKRLHDLADAIDKSHNRECFCLRWSSTLFLALITMNKWANGEKTCGFECAQRFLSFDRLLRFLGKESILDLNGQPYGVDSRGEKKIRTARNVSLKDSSGRFHYGTSKNISIPVHGVRVDWGEDVMGFEFCSDIYIFSGVGQGEAEFVPFSDTNAGKEMAFRWLYDFCEDGLEPLYIYD